MCFKGRQIDRHTSIIQKTTQNETQTYHSIYKKLLKTSARQVNKQSEYLEISLSQVTANNTAVRGS